MSRRALHNQNDCLEQAGATFERAQYAFTAALRYQELESETNPGHRPRALRQTLPGVKDLGEDLVQQAKTQIMTLARSEEVKDIESEVTCQLPQRQEKD